MGQLHSNYNKNNDELTNAMIKRHYICTMDVEKVFRCVDRGFYLDYEHKAIVYSNNALQLGNHIHLSAPSVYATVLESLELMPGNKFLNIGSGIGYFSTIAGLLIGSNGVNHGIEIHQLLVDKAYEKMNKFKSSAAAIDHYEFCEPVFIQGNACELSPLGYYDRVYCGAGIPPQKSEFMKSLINIGGILVMSLDGVLLQITRKDEHLWQQIEITESSFTDLVVPEKCNFNSIKFPVKEPMSLLEQSRLCIRSFLRSQLQKEFPYLKIKTKCQKKSYIAVKNMIRSTDPSNQLIHIQNNEEMINFQNPYDSFLNMNDVESDSSLESDNIDNIDTIDNADESIKNKYQQDTSCFEQSSAPTEIENRKLNKMESLSSENDENAPSTSSHNIWENASSDSSEPCDINNKSIILVSSDDDSSDSESYKAKEANMYHYENSLGANELSIRLNAKIKELNIPVPLKHFLNYYRDNGNRL